MDTPTLDVPAPGSSFNFAQHLIECNAARLDKAAFIDDHSAFRLGRPLREVIHRRPCGRQPDLICSHADVGQ